MYKLLLVFIPLLAAGCHGHAMGAPNPNCSLPLVIPCPPDNYCTNASTVIVE